MKYKVSDLASFINLKFIGSDFIINNVVSLSSINQSSMSFVTKKDYKFDQSKEALIIAIDGHIIEENSNCTFIFSPNPRLDFVKLFNEFFKPKKEIRICSTTVFGKSCRVGDNVSIGEYCVIKDDVSIDDGTVINNHVIIESNTEIGKNCYIKSGSVIGEDGFGFERDENSVPLRFPHIGNVVIGNNVEIGAKCTIARGTLESTVIKDNVKMDDQVFIAHNVVIGENTMVTACSEISGSTQIGKNCWIGPNSTIGDGLKIGDNVFLGIAAVISQNIKDNTKLASLSDLTFRDIVGINKLFKGKKP